MNEYMQVIISILHNAKDTLLHRKTENPRIMLNLYENDEAMVFEISDNAGGVHQNDIHRIFDPYFTTKHKSLGTGLGLYISKMIIEKNMNGTLSVSNTHEGAMFTIIMPKTENPHAVQ